MPKRNTELLDAQNFRNRLNAKVRGGSEEGVRIRKYLKHVVPDWKVMNDTRLYNHIQHMLDRAEEIRRFEIELIWKRAIYFMPLLVIFFTAFGGVFYAVYDTECLFPCLGYMDNENDDFFSLILFLIAIANAFLSFCLAKMNAGNHRWQRNWEYHVDYLQAIVGVNMIRIVLKKKINYFTIGRTNILISVFIFTVWLFVAIVLFVSTVGWFDGVFSDTNEAGRMLLSSVSIVAFTFVFYMWVTWDSFWEDRDLNIQKKMDIRFLQDFSYE